MKNSVDDVDNFCPTRSDSVYWNESCWFSFSIPERKLHGMVDYFFRPNMNVLIGGPIIWDESGSHYEDCLFSDWHQYQAIPEGAGKFNFTSQTSLSCKIEEPRRKYRLGYDQNGVKLDLLWAGLQDPHHFLGMEIEAYGAGAENRMHIEQMGRVTGTIDLRGEILEIDSYALRDSSWGERNINQVKRGSYFWAIADDNTAFHVQTMGDGDEQKVIGGFLMLDGELATLRSGSRLVTDMGEWTPHRFILTLEDKLGRTAQITAETASHLQFYAFPRCQVTWSLLHADFGNGKSGWGDIQEFQPMEMFRKMVRVG